MRHVIVLLVFAATFLCQSASHADLVAGDLAPYGTPDGVLNVADVLVLTRMVTGQLTPTPEEQLVGDVAPLNNPDGQLNAGDIAVLQRAVLGLVTLPPIITGPNPPALDPGTSPTSNNPFPVTGTASADSEVRLYVNDIYQTNTTAAPDGSFSFNAILLQGVNTIYATEWDGSQESAPSNQLSIEYVLDPPVLAAGSNQANANPYAVTGTSTANKTIYIYINGTKRHTVNTDANGAFGLDVYLFDGSNDIHATVWDGYQESAASNTLNASYTSTLPHNWSGTITQSMVLTPGPSNQPYTISGYTWIPSGVTVAVMPGTEIRFQANTGSNYALQVHGTLLVLGDGNNPVIFTSDEAVPAIGDWRGITVMPESNGTVIEKAQIEYADNGVWLNGADAIVRNNTITNVGSGVFLNNNATGLVEGNTIDNFNDSGWGIYVDGVSTTISGNTIQNTSWGIFALNNAASNITGNSLISNQYGAYLISSPVNFSGNIASGSYMNVVVDSGSPIINGNTLDSATVGIFVTGGTAAPLINGGNTITANVYGVYADGDGTATGNPAPVVSGNNLFGNSSYDYYTFDIYTNGGQLNVVFDATGNWWGTADPYAIPAEIADREDFGASYPKVNFGAYLDGLNGQPVFANWLMGDLSGTSVLTSGEQYEVLGDITVPTGDTLTVQSGAGLHFSGSYGLFVDGTLSVQGTSTQPVLMTTTSSSPYVGIWDGIQINTTSAASSIDYAQIEWASTSVSVAGTNLDISNSSITRFSIGLAWTQGATGLASDNYIDNASSSGTAVSVNASSPEFTGNSVQNSNYGFYIQGTANPLIHTGNLITSNNYGVYVNGTGAAATDPNPVVTGNSIFANSSYNYYADVFDAQSNSSKLLDATGNWWGDADPLVIGVGVRDYHDDNADAPIVSFGAYLDQQGGSPVNPDYLIGSVGASGPLTSGTSYEVLGTLTIAQGDTLTIESGASLQFVGDFDINVQGTVNVQGTSSLPVTFTTISATPNPGDWGGFVLSGTSSALVMDYALIEYADRAIWAQDGNVTLTNSTLQNNVYGLLLSNAGGSISSSTLQNNSYGAWLDNSSPTFSGNQITNNIWGLYLVQQSNPLVNSGNLISLNQYGVYLLGSGASATGPDPVVTGNSIHSNTNTDFYSDNYDSATNASTLVNASSNWWGTTDLQQLRVRIRDYQDDNFDAPVVNFGGYLDAQGGVVVNPDYLIGTLGTLVAGTSYQVLGDIRVDQGQMITVPSGVQFNFTDASHVLRVYGQLDVQGTSPQPVRFTSADTTPAAGSWAGIVVGASGDLTLSNGIVEYADRGIFVDGGAATVSDTTLENNTYGVYIINASPTFSANLVQNNTYGFYITQQSNPVINGGNNVTANQYGIYVRGTGDPATSPGPVINGNSILNNTIRDYDVDTYGSTTNQSVLLNATGNWWGNADPGAITAQIRDYRDDSIDAPIVNFGGYLDQAGGSAVNTNYLVGPVSDAQPLTGGVTYQVLGGISVDTGETLTVPAGVRLEMTSGSLIEVSGDLVVQGASGNEAVFTYESATPTAGGWTGIRVYAGAATVTVDHAIIEYSSNGIHFDQSGAVGSVTNSMIRNNLNGFYIYGNASPAISGNEITANNYGLNLSGPNTAGNNPNPLVNGNSIYDNSSYNFYAYNFYQSTSVRLDATANWWGGTDIEAIAGKIYDYTDNATNAPVVNYGGFLDGVGGAPAIGETLTGPFLTTQSLTANTTYDVLGQLNVPVGVTLTIPQGVTLRFPAYWSLSVDGSLSIQGASNNRVKLTSGKASLANGSWFGIVIKASASSAVINYADIEWATRGVDASSASLTVTNSRFSHYSNEGIYLNGVGTGLIDSNRLVSLNRTGTGIRFSQSSPTVSNNVVQGHNYGLYIQNDSDPLVTGNTIVDNTYGLYISGTGDDLTNPQPVVTGNDIYSNSNAAYIANFGAATTLTLDLTSNWWGTTDPVTIGNAITGNSAAVANYSAHSNQANTGPVVLSVAISELYFSPDSNGTKDATLYTGTLTENIPWNVLVKDSNGAVIRTSPAGSGSAVSFQWDGMNDSAQVVTDGQYELVVMATGAGGSAESGAVVVYLDNTAPSADLLDSLNGSTLQSVSTVAITGTAADGNPLEQYLVEFSEAATPGVWSAINTGSIPIVNGLLADWAINAQDGSVLLENGGVNLRLTVTDKAGNISTDQVALTLSNLHITAVSKDVTSINPALGETVTITFTLDAPADVTLRILPENGSTIIRETTQSLAAGTHNLSWDGRDSGNNPVTDEAYAYELYATDGVRSVIYNPGVEGTPGGSTVNDANYNFYTNDFWKTTYTLTTPARLSVYVSASNYYPVNAVPYDTGTHVLYWDGRGATGLPVTARLNVSVPAAQKLKTNSVIVDGVVPEITGTSAAPDIEVKSDPYLVYHSYEQLTNMSYRIDQDAYVTIKLLPPGVSDPQDSSAIVLIDNQLQTAESGGQPVDHQVSWTGYDVLDTNNILIDQDGSYTFAIEATSAATGFQTLYRGFVQLYR
jgi:parallel beta-helix repeat protein